MVWEVLLVMFVLFDSGWVLGFWDWVCVVDGGLCLLGWSGDVFWLGVWLFWLVFLLNWLRFFWVRGIILVLVLFDFLFLVIVFSFVVLFGVKFLFFRDIVVVLIFFSCFVFCYIINIRDKVMYEYIMFIFKLLDILLFCYILF